jgi:hypothetical protein
MATVKLTPTRKDVILALVYFFIPALVIGIAYLWRRDWFIAGHYRWRLSYCFLTGCWGLAIRAYERRDKVWVDSKSKAERFPWDYFSLYPLVLFMNACAVFTVLMLFADKLNNLFWTAALPLSVILGRYASPREWKLTQALDRLSHKTKDSGDGA